MYYVIKQQQSIPMRHFIGFVVNKYIASKSNKNVIFEFTKNGKIERKWVKKSEIVLLTDNKEYFLDILNQLKVTETTQQELVNLAKEQLEESIKNFETVMNEEMDKVKELKNSDDVDYILNDF